MVKNEASSCVYFSSDMLKVGCGRVYSHDKARTLVGKIGDKLGYSIIYLLCDRFSCLINNELHQLKKGTLIVLRPEEKLELYVNEDFARFKSNVTRDGANVHFITVDIISDLLFDGDTNVESFMRAFSERKLYTANFYTDADFYPQNIMESCSMLLTDYIDNNLGLFQFKSVVSLMITQINLAFDRHNNYVPTKYSDEYEVKVNTIELLPDVKESVIEKLTINAPLTEINDELIEELSSLVKSHPGNVELNFHIQDDEGQQINLAAKTLKINVQKDIIAFLKSQTALSYKIN